MTSKEFDECASLCNKQFQTGRRCAAARRVLVDGMGLTDAGREAGLHKQAVADAVARIEREHRGIIGCPRGWAVITVCVPAHGEEAAEIRDIERRAWRAAGLLVD